MIEGWCFFFVVMFDVGFMVLLWLIMLNFCSLLFIVFLLFLRLLSLCVVFCRKLCFLLLFWVGMVFGCMV